MHQNYILVYDLASDLVRVLRVLHAAPGSGRQFNGGDEDQALHLDVARGKQRMTPTFP